MTHLKPTTGISRHFLQVNLILFLFCSNRFIYEEIINAWLRKVGPNPALIWGEWKLKNLDSRSPFVLSRHFSPENSEALAQNENIKLINNWDWFLNSQPRFKTTAFQDKHHFKTDHFKTTFFRAKFLKTNFFKTNFLG